MTRKNIRIKDIARLAGVSVGTVDRVLHNRGRVSEDALKKVTKVMEEIDYKPNLIARTLGSNKSYRLAALIPNPSQDPYWELSKSGINQAEVEWGQYGVHVEVFPFDLYDNETFKIAAEAVFQSKPDGILVAPIFYHEALPFFHLFRESGIPYVLFNTSIPEVHPLSFIGQNLYQSGRVGAELMLTGQQGPGTFAVLHINEDIHNSVHLLEKERGFREFCEEKSNGSFIIKTLDLSNRSKPSFEDQLQSLLDDPHLKGIFVSTSKGSIIAASIIEKHGKRGVRVVGYDLLEESLPFLKSGTIDFLINQNPKRQAFLGISHLANHLLFKKQAPPMSLFPLEVITQQNVESYLGSGIH